MDIKQVKASCSFIHLPVLIGILIIGCSEGSKRVADVEENDSFVASDVSPDNDILQGTETIFPTDETVADDTTDSIGELDEEEPSAEADETMGDIDVPDSGTGTDISTGDEISSDDEIISDSGTSSDTEQPDSDSTPSITLPPANAQFDYQLGGSYPPPAGVLVLARDRTESPVNGLYNICYVNGFQTQPDDADWWLSEHPDLILRDENGDPVIDPDWPDEMILDITTPAKRSAIASIIGEWITQCAVDGYQAAEIDNLDTYSRSDGRIDTEDAVAMVRLFAETAHASGLAIAQKNAVELSARRAETLLDFAIAEECNQYSECGDYTDYYGDLVFVIEYRKSAFQKGCSLFPHLSIILRDVMLVTPSDPGYVYDAC